MFPKNIVKFIHRRGLTVFLKDKSFGRAWDLWGIYSSKK